MSFTGTFTMTAQPGNNIVLFTDTSTGDETIIARTLTLTKTDGTTLVPDGTTTTYIDWPVASGSTLLVDVMPFDYAPQVTVSWTSNDPQEDSTYVSSVVAGFTSYSDNGEYGIIQVMTAVPFITHTPDYLDSLFNLQVEMDNVSQAVYYQQQDSAQAAIDRATNILNNQLQNF